MTKIKVLIIQTLKEFEQRDFKRGGVSIAPEMYNAIADKLYSRLLGELPTHGRADGLGFRNKNKDSMDKREQIIDLLNKCIIGESVANTADRILALFSVVGRSEQFCKTDISNSSDVVRTERGWAGHFIGANRCMFSRNTLLAYNSIKIVVSTVGLMKYKNKFEPIGLNRYFETMAFHSNPTDTRYYDADISKKVDFDSEWAIAEKDADDKANEMHEAVVLEITNKLLAGETFHVME